MSMSPIAKLLLAVFLPVMAAAQSRTIPPPKYLTDQEAITILLQRLEQGIKDQNHAALWSLFAPGVEVAGEQFSRHQLTERFLAAFDSSHARWNNPRFQRMTPAKQNITTTWDFELEIDTVRVLGGGNALAETWIYFGAAQPDSTSDWRFGRKQRENIHLQKIGGEWRMTQTQIIGSNETLKGNTND